MSKLDIVVRGATRIDLAGTIHRLDGRSTPEETIREEDVQDPKLLTRHLARILKTVADLRRQWVPRRMDFEDLTILGTSSPPYNFTLTHNFGGRVRWWVLDHEISGTAGAPIIQRNSVTTDVNTLGLSSYKDARVTIRIEEAG